MSLLGLPPTTGNALHFTLTSRANHPIREQDSS